MFLMTLRSVALSLFIQPGGKSRIVNENYKWPSLLVYAYQLCKRCAPKNYGGLRNYILEAI